MKKQLNLVELVAGSGSRKSVELIIRLVGSDAKRFDELMVVFLGDDEELARRAAWPISYIATEHPGLMKKWFARVVKILNRPDLHPAMYRNVFRFLQTYPVPKRFQAELFDHALAFMNNPKHPPAIRAFAMMTAMNVAGSHPELYSEIELIVKQLMTEPSPAIRSRGRRILSLLSKTS
jgi:hypothetical protein